MNARLNEGFGQNVHSQQIRTLLQQPKFLPYYNSHITSVSDTLQTDSETVYLWVQQKVPNGMCVFTRNIVLSQQRKPITYCKFIDRRHT